MGSLRLCRAGKALAVGLLALAVVPAGALAGSTGSDQDAKAASAVEKPAKVWESDLDCLGCHTVEASSLEDDACLASSHAAVACTTCHSDGEVLQERHDKPGKRLPKRLKKTSVEPAVCLSCHGDKEGTAQPIAEATADSEVLTDKEGLTVNPHDLPANASHEKVACTDCHKMHDDEADVEKQAQLACLGCHHENVYECGTCHAH